LAVPLLSVVWFAYLAGQSARPNSADLILAGVFVALTVASYHYPIYLRHTTKLYVMSVPLFLMAATLQLPLAATSAALAVGTGELLVRSRRDSYLSDVATHVGRWIVIVLIGSACIHLPVGENQIAARGALLIVGACVMWLGDMLSIPLAVSPISGEHPRRIIVASIREAGLIEAFQYAVGLVAATASLVQPWLLVLFVLPTVVIFVAAQHEIEPDTYQLLTNMADSIDSRDPFTVDHSLRVATLAANILSELDVTGQEATAIVAAARFHDIGKFEVPDQEATRAGPLSEKEREVIESHAVRGAELLRAYPDCTRLVEIVEHHHEAWDGSGYPSRLSGPDIPFGARVIAVAESFDAMTHDRPYRLALSAQGAGAVLIEERGKQWDPNAVDAFLRVMPANG
jgi:putative nucleotidyltransferase with HDIG domain